MDQDSHSGILAAVNCTFNRDHPCSQILMTHQVIADEWSPAPAGSSASTVILVCWSS